MCAGVTPEALRAALVTVGAKIGFGFCGVWGLGL